MRNESGQSNASACDERGAPCERDQNRDAPGGISPVRTVGLKGGRSLKVVAPEAGFPLTTPLGGAGIRTVGGTPATCSLFHAGTIVTDVPGRFEACGPGAFRRAATARPLVRRPAGRRDQPRPAPPPYDPGDPSGGFCGGELICPY